jgi:hypothetical protein
VNILKIDPASTLEDTTIWETLWHQFPQRVAQHAARTIITTLPTIPADIPPVIRHSRPQAFANPLLTHTITSGFTTPHLPLPHPPTTVQTALFQHAAVPGNLQPSPTGMSQTPHAEEAAVTGPQGPAAYEGRVSEDRHYEAEEAQLGRAEDCED